MPPTQLGSLQDVRDRSARSRSNSRKRRAAAARARLRPPGRGEAPSVLRADCEMSCENNLKNYLKGKNANVAENTIPSLSYNNRARNR